MNKIKEWNHLKFIFYVAYCNITIKFLWTKFHLLPAFGAGHSFVENKKKGTQKGNS